MANLAGEMCDGAILHPFINESYLDTVVLTEITAGLAASGRSRDQFFTSCPIMLVMGDDEANLAEQAAIARKQIAFYGSTPAYKGVLEAIGYGDLQLELQLLSREGRWDEMGERIDDVVLHSIALVGTPEEMPQLVHDRFGGRLDRVSSYFGWPGVAPERLTDIVASFRRWSV